MRTEQIHNQEGSPQPPPLEENGRRELHDGRGRTCLRDGSRIGRYTASFLAAGGMSIAYKGEHQGRTYVLKEVAIDNATEVPALISEKSLLERLNHPGVVGFEELLTVNGYYYLVVEYVPGEPLSQWEKTGTLPGLEDVVDWGIQLTEIFDYLHSCDPKIIYRDLKPENVLVSSGKVKLIDFGIARLHKDGREKDTALLGSRVTASPEHYGRGQTDERSDIYTLSATLYQLLLGPKLGRSGAFGFTPVKELRPEVPAGLSKLLEQGLSLEPEERPQTALEFRDALCRVIGREVPTRDQNLDAETLLLPTTQIVPPSSRSKITTALMTLLGVALFMGIGFHLKGHHSGATKKPSYQTAEGLKEVNLDGDIFSAGVVDESDVVLLGEDVGLFQVTGWKRQTSEERAQTLAKRLNGFYHQFCSLCGKSKLEPQDIRVGRYTDTKDVAVFYAHAHSDGKVIAGPLLLATITAEQAEKASVTPRFLAATWRDLLKDTVQLSRGFAIHESALGEDLEQALAKARTRLKTGEVSTANLRRVLREVTGKESLKLRRTFLRLPDGVPEVDHFEGIPGYEPLNI